MSYPKPLSEKSLNRLYMQAGLSTETCAFLHSLFAACANLYGTIALRDVWSVYQELKSDVPRIHRRDLIAFSSIVRREVQPYWVYEIEELYTEEPHNDLDRHIVSKELIGAGYGKMFSFYALMDERDDRPYCVPDDFLSYAEPTASVEEKSLADFIGNLKSTVFFSQFERAVQFGLLQESPRHLFCPAGRVQRYRGGKDYAVSSASRECWSSAHNGYDPECAD